MGRPITAMAMATFSHSRAAVTGAVVVSAGRALLVGVSSIVRIDCNAAIVNERECRRRLQRSEVEAERAREKNDGERTYKGIVSQEPSNQRF